VNGVLVDIDDSYGNSGGVHGNVNNRWMLNQNKSVTLTGMGNQNSTGRWDI